GVGLTAADRDTWATERQCLLNPATPSHATNFAAIESALSTVCLDDHVDPRTAISAEWTKDHGFHNGDGRNRWIDKLIVGATMAIAIQEVRTRTRGTKERLDTSQLVFTDHGARWLQVVNLDPNAFVQLALQLAYYRLHKRPSPTYASFNACNYPHDRELVFRAICPQRLRHQL
ncbi:Carnitine O-acetyltransferase mitochondrial, partial [Tieghemiomyces parasiticus]